MSPPVHDLVEDALELHRAATAGDRIYLFSNAPGTILEQIPSGRPDKPAIVKQAEPAFTEAVRGIREKIAQLEAQAGVL